MLPKTTAYVKTYCGQSKWMYFLIEDDDLLEKDNGVWDKEFDSKPVYNKKFLKTKMKSHGGKLQIFTIKKFLRTILIIPV